MPKLTLSAEKEVIEQAKQLAAQRGTSVSAMFSQYVQSLASADQGEASHVPLGPVTRKALGLVKLPADASYRDLIEAAIAERHQS